MKSIKPTLLAFLLITLFFSCKKDENAATATQEKPATGTLGSAQGICEPVALSGTFTQGVALTLANTVTFNVTVATPGTYAITTTAVNGVTFSKTGTFTSTGVISVTLEGTGTPANPGSRTFTVTFGTSTCNFSINFEAAPATGTLGGEPGKCTPVTISPNPFDQVTIQVNVATTGPYRITTNTLNGVTYTRDGVFASTGLQNVQLFRTGSPLKTSSETYTVAFGSSSCSFTVTFTAFGPDNLFNYFPTSAGSFWSYKAANAQDSLSIRATGITRDIDGKIYDVFTRKYTSSPIDSTFFRKSGGEYFQNLHIANGSPTNVDFKYLDENAPVGVSWRAANYVQVRNGVADTITIDAVISSKKAAETLGAITFNDVIIVGYFYYSRKGNQPPFLYARDEKGFARKVGMIRTGTELVYSLQRVRVE